MGVDSDIWKDYVPFEETKKIMEKELVSKDGNTRLVSQSNFFLKRLHERMEKEDLISEDIALETKKNGSSLFTKIIDFLFRRAKA